MNLIKITKLWCTFMCIPLIFAISSCSSDDDPVVIKPVSSFQFEVDAADFFKVNFSNFSQNATTYAWDFGDNVGTSSDESPSYVYSASGTYTVTLTASDATTSVSSSKDITITDPDEALTLLAGSVSKTWKLLRDGAAIGIGPDYAGFTAYFFTENDGKRPCFYDDSFVFTRAGGFEFDDAGTFWGESNVYPAGSDREALYETCFDATAANLTIDGVDKSAWLSSTSHTFEYNVSTGKITLNGLGAWMGLIKLGTDSDGVNTPQASNTFNAVLASGGTTGVDTLDVYWDYPANGYVWRARYVSYSEASLEPTLVTEYVAPACDPLAAISPTEISHTFASNDAADWVLLQFDANSGSQLELGVADPADANATSVGKYIRVEGVSYQELQFKLDPANAINFENLTTITMDVFLPSTNDYTAGLTDNVFVGIGATECQPPNWYEDQIEYQQMAVAKDEWVTITFQLDAPTYAAGSNTTPSARNDFDMIYIAIGGGDHGTGAEFFMRNFVIQ